MQAGEEIARSFFVAGGDASELFDELKETLDEVAFGVEGEVAIASDLAIRFWRDDRLDRPDFEALDKAVGVVAFVAEEGFGLHFSREGLGLGDVVDLAAGEASANGLPKASTITWILVVRPPRERPMAWSKPPFCVRPHYADGL